MTSIRVSSPLDSKDVCEVHLSAFPDGEGQLVATLAASLLREETTPETISLVAEVDYKIVAHIAFSPVYLDSDKNWKSYILAPLGVKPEFQRHRIGSKLIESGIGRLSKDAVNVLFVYGDPKYYSKFGFTPEVAHKYLPPYELEQPFGWQAIALNGALSEQHGKISCVASLRDPTLW